MNIYIPHLENVNLSAQTDYRLAELLRKQEGLRDPDADAAVGAIAQEIANRAIRKAWREEGRV